jgi:signal recognition particle receptor subunit alpha
MLTYAGVCRYNKDAASIAMEAVKYAGQTGFDVVLVDTAGRMQDNEPLMRSLSISITLNPKPETL